MTPDTSIEAFVTLCGQTERLTPLWEGALDFCHARGIKMVSYHSSSTSPTHTPQIGVVEDGFPKDWVCKYIDGNLSQIDPVLALSTRLQRPFLWSEVGQIINLSGEQARYMDIRAEANLGDGLAMQVFGPNMRNAFVGLGFGQNAPSVSAKDIFELQCAAQMAHIRYCEITNARRPPAELSPRELDVLHWIAKGKSNSVIGDILGISRHTVDTMTRRMFEKLDVNDRTSAAVRGLGSGLLVPGNMGAG